MEKIKPNTGFRIEPKDRDRLDQLAQKHDMTVSQLCRRAVREFLDKADTDLAELPGAPK